ncbi:hypothetical protein N7527_009277 [Penicillium freii]|uniref:Uncharacterized protein n=1 Tax=Penicillium freii TaxID=48697 RepID=A0A101MQA2_PENFR|nr:hypothetical protein N7527_009277 [Penicillium freii]KUM64752.1 hypothetical protein ACN42_g2331 [Penicillium freii]
MVVKADKSDLSGLQYGNFSAHLPVILSIPQPPISQHPRIWVTSNPNTQDHINSSRNGANDSTRETQTLNTRHFRQHDNNQNRLLLLTAEHFPLDWVGTLKHGAPIIELFWPSYS